MKKLLSIFAIICSTSLLPLNEASCFFNKKSSNSSPIIETINNATNITAKGSNLLIDTSDDLTKRNILNDIGISTSDQSKVILSGELNDDPTQTSEITFTVKSESITKPVTWLKMSAGDIMSSSTCFATAIKKHDKECIVISGDTGLWKSTDNGDTFINIPFTYGVPISILSTNNGDIYIGTVSTGLWKSTDNANSFQQLTSNNIPTSYCKSLYQTTDNHIWLGTLTSLWESDDGIVFNNTNVTTSDVDVIFQGNNIIFIGSEAGLYKSTDNGDNFNLIDGFPVPPNNFLSMDLSGDIFYISSKDGVYESTDNGNIFSQLSSDKIPNSRAFGIYYDSSNHTTYFGSGYSNMFKTSDDKNFDDISYETNEAANITDINSVLLISGSFFNQLQYYSNGIWYYAI